MRGRCPRPLDDSASELHVHLETGRAERSACYFRMVYEPEQAILFTSHFYLLLLLLFPTIHLSSPGCSVFSVAARVSNCAAATRGDANSLPVPSFLSIFFWTKNRIRVTIWVRDYCLNSLPPASLLAFLLLGPALPARTAPAAGPK